MSATFCTKAQTTLRNQDFFGIPVQLTHKGQSSFNTAFGGVVSILFIMSMAVYFVQNLYTQLTSPVFQSYPATYNYDNDNTQFVNVSSADAGIHAYFMAYSNNRLVEQSEFNSNYRV